MRGLALLATGLVTGLSLGSRQAQDRDIVSLNHVAISVENYEEAVEFYSQTLGFPEAFAFDKPDGSPMMAYFQINRNTFIELMPAGPEQPVGLDHFGVEVSDAGSVLQRLRERGLRTTGPDVSPRTNTLIGGVATPGGGFVELLEFGPESLHRRVIEAWR